MKTAKKGLDPALLEQSLQKRGSMDREVYRMLQLAKNVKIEAEKFSIIEEDVEHIKMIVENKLPSDEEIQSMKDALVEEELA